jgi:hypothetical protein
MLCALMLCAVLATSEEGAEVATPATTRIELVARVGETRFAAFNPGHEVQLLLVGAVGGPRPRAYVLEPGGLFEARFPAELLEGLALEVISPAARGLSTTGAIAFATLVEGAHEALWIQSSLSGSYAWGQQGQQFEVVPADGALSALPPPVAAAVPHVPVITPSKGKVGDLPPRLENKPLPPF